MVSLRKYGNTSLLFHRKEVSEFGKPIVTAMRAAHLERSNRLSWLYLMDLRRNWSYPYTVPGIATYIKVTRCFVC